MDVRENKETNVKEFLLTLADKNPKYQKNLHGELKAFFNSIPDLVPKIPKFPKVTIAEPAHNWIDKRTQDKIFRLIPERDKGIFTFLRYTGCRPNESRGLLRENVHLDQKEVLIVNAMSLGGTLKGRTKTGKLRVLPIIPEIEGGLTPKG